MLTIKEYIEKNPVWFDGTQTTYKKIRIALKSGKLKSQKKKNVYYIGNDDGKERANDLTRANGTSDSKLKETYREIKIKRERQLLYEDRLLIAEKVAEVFVNEFHNPRVAALAEIVRKNGSEGLFKLWNQEVISGFQERLNRLQEELHAVIMS